MIFVLVVALLLGRSEAPEPELYAAWTDTGYHLCLSDNGTPDDPEDDFVVDWEDDREYTVVIKDNWR